MIVLCGTILMMMALGAAGAGWTPGSEYAGGSSMRTNSVYDPFLGNLLPQNQNVSIVGRINTNDIAIFTDRSGRFVRGTNLIGQVQGWAQEATTGAVSLATLAYTMGTNAQATADVAYGWGNHALAGYLLAPAVSNIANYAAATLPAPTGVPIWYDSSDSNYFATCSGGTGIVWKVSNYATNFYVILSSNFSILGQHPSFTSNAFPFAQSGSWYSGTPVGSYQAGIYYSSVGTALWGSTPNTLPISYPLKLLPVVGGGTGTATVHRVITNTTNLYTRIAYTNDLGRYLTLADYAANTNALNDQIVAIQNNAEAMAAIATNAPTWQVYSNRTGIITLTNAMEKPVILQGTGALSLAFSGLRSPRPVYAVLAGFSSVAFPSNTYIVGGGAWQTNRANHFIIWNYGSGIYVNPLTTTE